MKRIIISLASVLILLFSLNINAFATSIPDFKKAIIATENGYYITETITEEVIISRATNTKTGQKKFEFYNSNDEILWSATLRGTFTYTGSRATCTASSITYEIFDDSWKITSATASKSGNTATGDVTAKRYALGIPVKTIERTITLTCSSSGVLS
ncbi:MAG: hypothetical protein IJN88_05100 [Clostridia bacterium]|nr:hypothetical protein [Clostridia bacterium]